MKSYYFIMSFKIVVDPLLAKHLLLLEQGAL